ncbi:MAG: ribosomal-processing cysteine protease Prp [Erysipelotrichaceae bacterium]|jgi:uncharacterized protein YsxB (DUF464 family)|nr:ribosomal-processing cysteine protease Prp [Erysipelotrichaceae bacterium]
MIHIAVNESNHRIVDLEIKGHAGSDVYGHDLVCAVVSGIGTGLCNALDELCGVKDIVVEEGHISIHIQHPSERTELILRTGLIQLQTAMEANRKFIIIKISEV